MNGSRSDAAGMFLRQPTGFGAAASPRQDVRTSKPFTTWPDSRMHLGRIVTASEHAALDSILPKGFETEKDKPATIMYEAMLLRNLPWLAGRGYNTCGVYIGNVKHAASGETGSYLAVLFESLCDPIITGREELGFPKVFADMRVENDVYTCSWDGHDFLTLDFTGAEDAQPPANLLEKKEYTHPMTDGLLAYRYMPAVGAPGTSDVEYLVKQPAAKVAQKLNGYKECPKPKLTVTKSTFQQLPTLHNIVNQLAALPNDGIIESGIYDLQEASDCGKTAKVDVKRI